MSYHKKISLLVVTVILAPRLMSAANFAVGTCQPKLKSFSTISAAVSSVPPGSSIHVCPGVYPEQVNILQPLTLQGVQYNEADRVVITVPIFGPMSGGLVVNATSATAVAAFGGSANFAAQVLVRTPGPVTIADITVDGTGGNVGCTFTDPSGVWLAGIFYATGSSGTVNRVTTRNQMDNSGPGYVNPCGVGIWAEDSTDPNQTFTIKNSNAHDFDFIGIFVGTDGSQEQQFAPMIVGNRVSSVPGGECINSTLAKSTMQDNFIDGGGTGIQVTNYPPNGASTITKNTITGASCCGIQTSSDATIASNRISDAGTGILVADGGFNTIENNIIRKTGIAIEANCERNTIGAAGKNNGIQDAGIGLDRVPLGLAHINTFHNVDTMVTVCGP